MGFQGGGGEDEPIPAHKSRGVRRFHRGGSGEATLTRKLRATLTPNLGCWELGATLTLNLLNHGTQSFKGYTFAVNTLAIRVGDKKFSG